MTNKINTQVAESIYIINKQAKQLNTDASKAYNRNNSKRATDLYDQRDALYEVKQRVLENIQPQAKKVEQHTINGSKYYCLYFCDTDNTEWSFHQPIDSFSLTQSITEQKTLSDFNSTASHQKSNRSLSNSLSYIRDQFVVSANSYISDNSNQFLY